MLRVNKIVNPSPEQFEIVIKGMRNAFKSWDKADSEICTNSEEEKEICYEGCPFVDHWEGDPAYPICNYDTYDNGPVFILGKNDKQLLLNLCSAGDPSHRKALRQLPVIMNINAPLYWWKQADKYQIGTVTNSESTMHTIMKKPFVEGSFSFDHIYPEEMFELLDTYNNIRERYLALKKNSDDEELNNTWYQLIEILPESYNQTRTWSLNYEVLLNIINQRTGHPVKEWATFIDYVLEEVPFLKEIYDAVSG